MTSARTALFGQCVFEDIEHVMCSSDLIGYHLHQLFMFDTCKRTVKTFALLNYFICFIEIMDPCVLRTSTCSRRHVYEGRCANADLYLCQELIGSMCCM